MKSLRKFAVSLQNGHMMFPSMSLFLSLLAQVSHSVCLHSATVQLSLCCALKHRPHLGSLSCMFFCTFCSFCLSTVTSIPFCILSLC